jgi:hypothetical protein
MAGNHDEHHDGPIHQAPWVFWVTVGACFGFAALVLGVKALTGTL